jgi:hypothetical protein
MMIIIILSLGIQRHVIHITENHSTSSENYKKEM